MAELIGKRGRIGGLRSQQLGYKFPTTELTTPGLLAASRADPPPQGEEPASALIPPGNRGYAPHS